MKAAEENWRQFLETVPTCATLEGDRVLGLFLKSHQNIGFLSNAGTDLLKYYKAAKSAFNVGPSSAR